MKIRSFGRIIWKKIQGGSNMKIKQKLMVLMCISSLLLSACDNTSSTSGDVVTTQTSGADQVTNVEELTGDKFDAADLYNDYDKSKSVVITLGDGSITSDGSEDAGVKIDGTTLTLTKGGNYYITGSCGDGKIIVDSDDTENVRLVLDNVNLTNTKGSVIYIRQAKKAIITAAGGSTNSLTDASSYTQEDEGVTAAVTALSDLTINGEGQLTVLGNYEDAISSNADMKIGSGVLNIQSKDDGIVASKGLSIKNGSFNLQCGGNGFKTTSTIESEGFIGIESGNYTFTTGYNICNATGSIYYLNGGFNGSAGGGSSVSSTEKGWGNFGEKNMTAKGFKASRDIQIYGGSLTFDTADDTLYAGNAIAVNNGCVIASSGDDGFVSNSSIDLNGGSVTLQKSFEGFESTNINLIGGYLDITSAADGINAANGTDSFATKKRPGKNDFTRADKGAVKVDNTCINIRSDRNGINVNGDLSITGGALRLRGGNKNSLSSISCSGKYAVSGGALLAAGNDKELVIPSDTTQPVVCLNYPEQQENASVICIKDNKGQVVIAFCVASGFDKVVLSQPTLEEGKEYTWYQATLTSDLSPTLGDMQDDAYKVGDKIATFKVEEGVTTVDSTGVVK